MNSKILIITAVVGIVALIGFNLMISHKPETATQATPTVTSQPTTNTPAKTADLPLGQQPKALEDKVKNQITQANADNSAKLDKIN